MQDHFITTSGPKIHLVDHGGEGPLLLLLHGLTANAHAFDGLTAAGVTRYARVWTADLRGRGLSDSPDEPYTIAATGRDLLQVMDRMGWERIYIGGHSYGAFLSWWLAAHHPERFDKVIAMDAAMRMHPNTLQMLGPSLARLGRQWPSWEAYIGEVRQAPYLSSWDDAMASYYRADVRDLPGGGVMPIPDPRHMTDAAQRVLAEPWSDILPKVKQPVLLINAPGVYTMNAPLLPEDHARETAALFDRVHFVTVTGNHQTMLYGKGAEQIVAAVSDFLSDAG